MITTGLLRAAVGCTVDLAERFAGPLSEACALFEINTPQRLAFFFANIGHESADLAKQRESMDYSADRLVAVFGAHRITQAQANEYGRQAGRRADQVAIANLVYGGAWGAKNLGNTQPGDGWTFRAAGPIGTTGRANFRELRPALLLAGYSDVPDFEAEPDRLTEPRWGAAAAGHYWASRGCNALADAGDFMGVCRAINLGDAKSSGTPNGMPDRMARLARAQAALSDVGQIDMLPKPVENQAEIGHVTYAPAGELVGESLAPAAQEYTMPTLTSVLGGAITAANPIAGLIFSVLAPAVQAKIDKEVARHDAHPEVAVQISEAIVAAAQHATGQTDPLQAAAAVQRDKAAADMASTTVGAKLDELMPLFDKIDEMDAKVFEAREQAVAVARKFNNDEPNILDFPWLKLKFIHILSIALVSFSGWFVTVNWVALTPELRGAVITLMVIAGWNGVKDYWMGSSRGSAAKDAVNAQLQQQIQRGKR